MNKLFSAYSTSAAYHQCASDARSGQSPWSIAIPEGDKWISTPTEPLSLPPQPPRPSHKKNKRPEPSKDGDITLSESIVFMRDAMIAREAVYAVAEGDVGRLWEALKVPISHISWHPSLNHHSDRPWSSLLLDRVTGNTQDIYSR